MIFLAPDDCKLRVTQNTLLSLYQHDQYSWMALNSYSDFDNNFLKLLIFYLPKNGFVKSEPVKEWNTGSIAHIFSLNWLLNEETWWVVMQSLEDVVSWRKNMVSLQLIDTWRSITKTSVSSATTQTDFLVSFAA